MAKTLQMIFRDEAGKRVTLNLAEPRDNLTMAEVKTVMQDIVAKNIFSSKSGSLVQSVDAKIMDHEATSLS
ncbi:hypothetical protein Ga0466249_000215 [Sporomusaceae bacterium BoRhaA]|uniref:DUF2922 domain-containing protein n=1 Tax=Pelorhabdus rhamnosifermentans TaxID=2772457 RepID=UPI001C061F82|nr:DUF2922 domain-containing protein [Pelorhabdus rhamnosifermentans]MBU2699136.1 hypothetical protein [Pelorhabdus rhamnosifermentans]